ncbi:MAG TPA: hypothetical protein VGQ90_05260 [Stellaceae bacterium]|nr:hypothetical protein [Stellaceae bacterium]
MRARVSAAAIAASVLFSGAAWSACEPGKSRKCVNLDLTPPVSQQVVTGEPLPPRRATAPAAQPTPAYTGPTVGVAPTVGRAPMVGYRWSIN